LSSRDSIRPLVDWTVVIPALGLATIGILFVWSTTSTWNSPLWGRQALFVLAGIVSIAVVMALGVRRLSELSYPVYLLLLVTLIVLPLLAEPSSVKSARWISMPLGFKLQPSEFMKLGLVLVLARHLQHRGITNTWRSYLGPFVLTALPWFFVMRQPDLGSSLILLPIFLAMVTVSGARLTHVFGVALLVVGLLAGAYMIPGVLKPYQKDRLDSFLTPVPRLHLEAREFRQQRLHDVAREIERDIHRLKDGTGYQQFYSVVAIGSGGFAGAGLGNGILNRRDRPPERHSDFIFAIVGEEWGLLGTSLVLLLYVALVGAILGVAHRTREPFGRLVCVGVAALIGGQTLMNLGIATGLLPVTGLPLPLISYGGSSILATALALGCVLDTSRDQVAVFFES
jgi:rod shape determining protein RodA